jgi:dihydrofolate reductase
MAKLIYSAIASLDGYITDQDGEFDWSAPDEEVHAFVNDLERSVGTHLLGRRMYEVLAVWDTLPVAAPGAEPTVSEDFAALWQAADKVVYSRRLDAVSAPRTRLERDLVADDVRKLVAEADRDVSVGGPKLAATAFAAGLVDEVHLFLNPIMVGGGKRALPDRVRLELDLIDERRFTSGVVYLGYRVREPRSTA